MTPCGTSDPIHFGCGSAALGYARSGSSEELHLLRIPLEGDVCEQRRAGGTKAEDRVLHHRLPAANGGEKVLQMVVAIAVAGRRLVDFLSEIRGPAG